MPGPNSPVASAVGAALAPRAVEERQRVEFGFARGVEPLPQPEPIRRVQRLTRLLRALGLLLRPGDGGW